MTPEQIGQALTQAGWRLDGGFSEYLIVGHDDDRTSIMAHCWVWENDTHVFELSDQRTRRVYWVHAVPTPWQAKLLLHEHGDPPEEAKLDTTYELGQYGYASSWRSGHPSLAGSDYRLVLASTPLVTSGLEDVFSAAR